MNSYFKWFSLITALTLLTACRVVKNEGYYGDGEDGMDPALRQIVMEEESEEPQQEEGWIPAPSDLMHMD
jgi:hypothetical protein